MATKESKNVNTAMSCLPLAKLAELKAKLGEALFNKALYGEETSAATDENEAKKQRKKTAGKTALAPKRPRVESSNRPPTKLRKIKGLTLSKRQNARFDPRFSAACGDFDEVAYHRDYSFLDELRQRDIKELQKAYRQAKREQNLAHAERVKRNLLRLQNQQKSHRDQLLMEQIRAELRQSNIERMNSGQAPVYLNNYELKERFLERKRQLYGESAPTLSAGQNKKQGEQGSAEPVVESEMEMSGDKVKSKRRTNQSNNEC